MSPNVPELRDDSIEALERTMREQMCDRISNWLCALEAVPEGNRPPETLREQAGRFLNNVRDWSRR